MAAFARLLKTLAYWPAVAILVWGGIVCFRLIQSLNGESFQLAVISGKETVHVTATNIRVKDWLTGIEARQLDVREQDGRLLASAQALSARGDGVLSGPWKADVDRVWARVDRRPDGAFAFQRFLSQPKGPQAENPFAINIHWLTAQYRDESGGGLWQRDITLRDANIVGSGDRLWIRSDVSLEGAGKASLDLLVSNSFGVRASGTGDLRLKDLVDHFSKTPEGRGVKELQDLKLADGSARGQYLVYAPPKEETTFWLDGNIQLNRVKYREYEADRVAISGVTTQRGFAGTFKAGQGGLTAEGSGQIQWLERNSGRLRVAARVSSRRDLPNYMVSSVPKDVSFGGAVIHGVAGWDEGKVRFGGKVSADTLTMAGETASGLQAELAGTDQGGAVRVTRATWMGASAKGAFAWEAKGAIRGYAKTDSVNLASLAKRFNVADFAGKARAQVVIGGTQSRPEATYLVEGTAESRVSGYSMPLGRLTAAGTLKGDEVQVRRLDVAGPNGLLHATGTVNAKTQAYSFAAQASGVPLSALTPQAEGLLAFAGTVKGRGKKYTGTGNLEVFDLLASGQSIPYATAKWQIDPQRFEAPEFLVLKNGMYASGSAGVGLAKHDLTGSIEANGVRFGDWAPGVLEGIGQIEAAHLGGTLEKPTFAGTMKSQAMVAGPLRLRTMVAQLIYDGSVLHLPEVTASTDTGSVGGSIWVDPQTKLGTFAFSWKDLDPGTLAPELSAYASVGGRVSGAMKGAFGDNQLLNVTGRSDISNFVLNDQVVGSGEANFSGQGTEWHFDAELGQIEQYVSLKDGVFDTRSHALSGKVLAGKVSLEQAEAIAGRYLDEFAADMSDPSPLQRLRRSTGILTVDLTLGGTSDDPILELRQLEASDLVVGGVDSGKLTASGSRVNGIWTVDSLAWKGEPIDFEAKGSMDEKGFTSLTGSVNSLRASWLAWLNPSLVNLKGIITAPLVSVDGHTDDPAIQASLGYKEPNEGGKGWSVELLASAKAGEIALDGTYFYEGLTGTIAGQTKYEKDFHIADEAPVTLAVRADKRPVGALGEFMSWIDTQRSKGEISAAFDVGGTVENLTAKAELLAEGAEIAIGSTGGPFESLKVGTLLKNPRMALRKTDTGLALSAGADGSDGGKIDLGTLELGLKDLSAVTQMTQDDWLALPLNGEVRAEGFKLVANDKSAGQLRTTLSTQDLVMKGTLGQPEIRGTVLLSGSNYIVPTVKEGEAPPGPALINPRFFIDVVQQDMAEFKAGAGSFGILGGAQIRGTMESLDINAPLVVKRGFVRLPNARIAIDEGGTIQIRYRDGSARADTNLTGRTQLSAASITGNVERYDITLEMTGDLLAQGGLNLKASADPPELSTDTILAMLGQRELITGVTSESKLSNQIQSALVGVALPYLGSTITDQLATSLGLDYLNVDYNAFEGVSVTGGLALGRYFTLSGRRQLSPPTDGSLPKWDIRLSYRPNFGAKALRRVSFSVGMNQDRPWRIAAEYGIKF